MEYQNLKIIWTSHIAQQSLDEVKEAIAGYKPDIIALELDRARLYSLTHNTKNKIRIYDIKRIGIKGFIFSLIGAWAEKKLGEYVGVSPGSEMKTAIILARKNNIRIALIDRDIELTLKRFSESLSWKEKFNFLADIIKSIFIRRKIEFDLRKVPEKEIINKLTKEVKKRYPNIYKVLITERNKIMAANLNKLIETNPDKKIVALIGAGHEEGISRLVKASRTSYSYSFAIEPKNENSIC